MIFRELVIPGAFAIDLELRSDDRGFFARTYCEEEFSARDLASRMVQTNVSFNHRAGTIRGMHMQVEPHGEAKLVRAIRGAIFDVAVDLRETSPTYLQHVGIELTADNRTALYVPVGCAHGYQTLTDATEVLYQVSTPYVPGAEQGYRYDDPAFEIEWPMAATELSPKDASWPLVELSPEQPRGGAHAHR
jgi:dTDP-4-dehydrorhamnose 3,5-epimerase